MLEIPGLTLAPGIRMPQLGLGVGQIPPDLVSSVVCNALEVGYRSIDTAQRYENENGVGEGMARSGLERSEIFLTTKVANSDHGYDATLRAFDASLHRLGMHYVDLYLIHWPMPRQDRYVETWRALTELAADGRARAIGVSNFETSHLERLAGETGVVPAVNQIELHPYFSQDALRAAHRRWGITTIAWAPLGQGNGVLADPTVHDIARRHGRTPAQIVLRWHLQLGHGAIPKTTRRERLRENAAVLDFALPPADMALLNTLDTGLRSGEDPAQVG